jgi:acyl-coenzyme A thioesterase PaaI-like protein
VADAAGITPEDLAARRVAVGNLGAALRGLVDAAVRTEVPDDVLAEAADLAAELAARLAVRSRGLGEMAAIDDVEAGERWYNPVYGLGSPLAPPMVPTSWGSGRATARVTLGKAHEGPLGLGHGGVIAMLFDHILARAIRSAGRGGMTASLTVSYRRPVPLGVPLITTAEMGAAEGRRTPVTARLVAEDDPTTTLAEAEGVFITPRP